MADALRKVAIACDHAGVDLKESIKQAYAGKIDFLDFGTHSKESCNWAEYGHKMGAALAAGHAPLGIVICGSGIGISMAANRHKGVRAALCMNSTMARLAREHNDANVLALGARITGVAVALDCVEAFLNTPFAGGRHKERVETLETMS